MAYLIASARRSDLARIRQSSPETWRQVRRYNLPVQLALAAAGEVMTQARNPGTMVVVSLAPCQPGSADLYRWGDVVTARMAGGSLGDLRMNPTQTLHAVDNLAMSAFAIAYGNHSYCLGLGGAAGQAWCALEVVLERLASGPEDEALVMAGDQDRAAENAQGLAVALLFSRSAQPYPAVGRPVRLLAVERELQRAAGPVVPHAATGLSALLSAIDDQRRGQLSYVVPFEHTDGVSATTVVLETL